jgi:hypothetical protein
MKAVIIEETNLKRVGSLARSPILLRIWDAKDLEWFNDRVVFFQYIKLISKCVGARLLHQGRVCLRSLASQIPEEAGMSYRYRYNRKVQYAYQSPGSMSFSMRFQYSRLAWGRNKDC